MISDLIAAVRAAVEAVGKCWSEWWAAEEWDKHERQNWAAAKPKRWMLVGSDDYNVAISMITSLDVAQVPEMDHDSAEAAALAYNLLRDHGPALVAALERLKTAERVPGHWRCPKCGFYNQRSTITLDGRIGPPKPGSEGPSAPLCPNDDVPMVAVTWQERQKDLAGQLDDMFDERNSLRARLGRIERAGRALADCGFNYVVFANARREWDEAIGEAVKP